MILREEDMFGPSSDPFDPQIAGSGSTRDIVVWLDRNQDLVALLRVGDEWPRLACLSEIEARIDAEDLIIEPTARLDPPWLDRTLSEEERGRRDERMSVIRPLIDAKPEIFDKVARGRMIGARAKETKKARNSIKKWLGRYFRDGRCANALLDRYEGSGHRRKGVVGDTWNKLGRPAEKPGKPRENVTQSICKEFQQATERERRFIGEDFRISGAYQRWKEEFAHVEVEVDGVRTARLADRYDDQSMASYDQFRRWYERTKQPEASARIILGEPIYAKDNRALTSTSTAETWGPGARFQIDATVVNFPVAARLRRNVLLGRPYLYFVRDVWSRMICGYYLGFEPPSQLAASLALLNAFTPKDQLLRDFGFDPDRDPWPAHHVCGSLLHDGGELTGHQGDWLVNRLRISFEQTSPERGDLKGAVETLFHWSDVNWSRTTKGRSSSPRYRPRARRKDDLVLAAAGELDTDVEFERKVIEFILWFNNLHVLDGYDADPDMIAAGVDRVPLDMFRWGVANRGEPRVYDPDYVRLNLMPRKRVSVDCDGLWFQKASYTAPFLQPLQAEAARTGRRIPGMISHDHRCNEVLWHDEDARNGFRVVGISDAHRWRRDLRLDEAEAIQYEQEASEAKRKAEEDRRNAEASMRRRREDAQRPAAPRQTTGTRAEAKAEGSATRRAIREDARLNAFGGTSKTCKESSAPHTATIHAFPGPRRNYAPPSLEEVDDND